MEIKSAVIQKKCEFYIMCMMPFIIVIVLKMFGDSSFSANNIVNVMVRVISLLIIGVSYSIGKKITDIKV